MKFQFTAIFVLGVTVGFVLGRRTPDSASPTRVDVPQVGSQHGDNSFSESAPEEKVAFSWALLESTNYSEYVQNLRAAKCPERTIADIIKAELTKLYAPRFEGITKVGYAKSQLIEQIQRQRAAETQMEAVMYNQLKLLRPARSASSLFSTEQEERIAEAGRLFPKSRPDPTNPASFSLEKSNRTQRIEFLSQYFSSQELLYYKLDREEGAYRVYQLLSGMQPSKEEFLAVAAAIDGMDGVVITSPLPPELLLGLQHTLSPERLALLQYLQKAEYRAIREFALSSQIAPDVVNSLVVLRRNVFPEDPITYTQQVKAVLTKPGEAEKYLNWWGIHPRGKTR